MELEDEVAGLRQELETALTLARDAVGAAERRQRRDLVPLHQSVDIYGQRGRIGPRD
jgi:hypothetical protein